VRTGKQVAGLQQLRREKHVVCRGRKNEVTTQEDREMRGEKAVCFKKGDETRTKGYGEMRTKSTQPNRLKCGCGLGGGTRKTYSSQGHKQKGRSSRVPA